MSSNRKNRSWCLKKRPQGEIQQDDLDLVENDVPVIAENEILAKTIYFSLDPTNRIWMSDIDQYMEPVEVGDVMRAGGSLAVVEESNVSEIKPGDIVQGGLHGGWQEYFIIPGEEATAIPIPDGMPMTAFMSVLGFTGPTAYFGFLDIGKPQPGET